MKYCFNFPHPQYLFECNAYEAVMYITQALLYVFIILKRNTYWAAYREVHRPQPQN
jgi:hypothetical protein